MSLSRDTASPEGRPICPGLSLARVQKRLDNPIMNKFHVFIVLILSVAGCSHPNLQALEPPALEIIESGRETSIRGLSVVDDSVAWVSGSNGWVGRSVDRGENWDWQQIKGFETFDFRDIEAFSSTEAVLLSAGSPLVILRTEDAGTTWTESYRDDRAEIFFDGLDFVESGRGIAYGDPIDSNFQLLETKDRGVSWKDISPVARLEATQGEAGFAASGSGIQMFPSGEVYIATGGAISRILFSPDFGKNWQTFDTPMIQGTSSRGIFSIAFSSPSEGIAVGGDYTIDTLRESAVWITRDGGRSWTKPTVGTNGYRSAVTYITGTESSDRPLHLLACGTSGVDYSRDGGVHWEPISKESYHVVESSGIGNWTLLAGADGRIAVFSQP